MMELDLVEQVFFIIQMFAIIAWLFFWSRNNKDSREIVQFIKLKSRPWVGPIDSSVINTTDSDDEHNFSVTLKNFGQIKAKNVHVDFVAQNHKPTKKQLYTSKNLKSNLGPLMPELLTNYSFAVDSNKIEKAKAANESLFVGLYISYVFERKQIGYGLISQYNPHSKSFERVETWDD